MVGCIVLWAGQIARTYAQMLHRLPAELPEASKTLVLQMLLKIADLGHLSHPMPLHKV